MQAGTSASAINGIRLWQERVRLGIRKNFFPIRALGALAQVAQDSCRVSFHGRI